MRDTIPCLHSIDVDVKHVKVEHAATTSSSLMASGQVGHACRSSGLEGRIQPLLKLGCSDHLCRHLCSHFRRNTMHGKSMQATCYEIYSPPNTVPCFVILIPGGAEKRRHTAGKSIKFLQQEVFPARQLQRGAPRCPQVQVHVRTPAGSRGPSDW
jgi:hypothetical protein